MMRDYADRNWVKKVGWRQRVEWVEVMFWIGTIVSIVGFSCAVLEDLYSPIYSFITIGGAIFAICAPIFSEVI